MSFLNNKDLKAEIATKLQILENAISAKRSKMRYACIRV
jgi:hypothetical protein